MASSIPVLGTAIVNAPYWLHRLFMSIDYPVDNFVVFNNNGRGQITAEVESVKQMANKFVKNVHVCHLPANLGCSGAWNLIIKSFMNAPYWVISNHDVMFEPGFLEEMNQKAQDPEVGTVHGAGGGWDIFLLKDWMVQAYGLFDENLYPGYCEDMDYGMRFIYDGVKRVLDLEHGYYHGSKKNDYSDGSQTWRSEKEIAEAIHVAHELNKMYLHHKWSPAWQAHVDGEVYRTPFNNPDLPIDFTMYNLEFVRQKHLGF
jgi:GT2 family glycosyltransferase